jgi:hypothetical protein
MGEGDMREDQLKLLEERINNAISFIETLKSREKKLLHEKEELEAKISSFDKVLAEKDAKIEELKGSQGFLREKIEAILGKLESFASIDSEGKFDLKELPETEKVDDDGIIEDEFVDLKEKNVDEETADTKQDEDISSDKEPTEDSLEKKEDIFSLNAEDDQESEKSDEDEDVIEGIVNEDIFEEETDEAIIEGGRNTLESENPDDEGENPETGSENSVQKQKTGSTDSLTAETVLGKDDNQLFTADTESNTGSLFQNDTLNKLSRINESRGGSISKRWIDNNPFIQT